MKIDQPTENALQALAHDLENVAESIRSRSFEGREKGTLDGLTHKLFNLAGKFGALIREER